MKTKEEQIIFHTFHNQIEKPECTSRLTIFFGLSGCGKILHQSKEHLMTAGSILLVNPFEMYQVECAEQTEIICMQISENLLYLSGWSTQVSCFYHANGESTDSIYREIRMLFATMFQDFFQDKEKHASTIISNALQMLHIFLTRFKLPDTERSSSKQEENMRRMKRIMDEIHAHWNEDISLRELAKKEYLSEGYLSRFLKRNLNMTYSQYIVRLRLSHAEKQLRLTNHSVTHIAYDCGFHHVSAFIEGFRQRYGVTPGQYKKQQRQQPVIGNQEQQAEQLQNGFAYLLQYAVPHDSQEEMSFTTRQVVISGREKERNLRHTWKNLLNVGYAKDLLTAEIQRQIQQTQREIGFRYARFHGILDDALHIYQGKIGEQVSCCFTFFDMVIDFLQEQKLIPFLEFSFMPSKLAKKRDSIYENGSITSPCADCQTFGMLIEAIIRHAIARYGWEYVSQWKFTTIQINYVFFHCMSMEEYLELWETVYHAVKRVDERLVLGGPGAMSSVVRDARGMRTFLTYAQEQTCMPDFFTVQSYPHESVTVDAEFMDYTINQQSIPSVLSKDPNFVASFLHELDQLWEEFHLSQPDVYIEEWNSTLWQRDLSSDTCYKSVWLVKNICENMDAAESFGYWTFSDFMDERADFHSLYHGGYGLFTYNGIPKSGYEALRLLTKLGEHRIANGDGWYITRSKDTYQVMLYNYSHYDNIYRHRYRRLEHPEDAYSVFETGECIRFQIDLSMLLPTGTYRVEQYSINRNTGSSFDAWLKMGAPASPNRQIQQYLAEHASSDYTIREVQVENELLWGAELRPLEITLFVLNKQNK